MTTYSWFGIDDAPGDVVAGRGLLETGTEGGGDAGVTTAEAVGAGCGSADA